MPLHGWMNRGSSPRPTTRRRQGRGRGARARAARRGGGADPGETWRQRAEPPATSSERRLRKKQMGKLGARRSRRRGRGRPARARTPPPPDRGAPGSTKLAMTLSAVLFGNERNAQRVRSAAPTRPRAASAGRRLEREFGSRARGPARARGRDARAQLADRGPRRARAATRRAPAGRGRARSRRREARALSGRAGRAVAGLRTRARAARALAAPPSRDDVEALVAAARGAFRKEARASVAGVAEPRHPTTNPTRHCDRARRRRAPRPSRRWTTGHRSRSSSHSRPLRPRGGPTRTCNAVGLVVYITPPMEHTRARRGCVCVCVAARARGAQKTSSEP